jgi:DMSO/TMAO reductase YedYZ molybdopterin-dependent catalytic subunit
VRIDGAVKKKVEFSMAELRNDFEQHQVIAALQVTIAMMVRL